MRTQKRPETANPDDLVPNPWNPNVMSPEIEAKLDNAVSRMGFFKPIVVREITGEDGRKVHQILGGEHRVGSARRLGLTEIPIFNLGEIDDERAKEIVLADNARYGFDDANLLADLFKDLKDSELQDFLPYSDTDVRAIFDASHIALDELDLDEKFETNAAPEPSQAKAPKTHALMRFKVPLKDAEKITDLIARTQKRHGLTTGDELTNAGDALFQLLLSERAAE